MNYYYYYHYTTKYVLRLHNYYKLHTTDYITLTTNSKAQQMIVWIVEVWLCIFSWHRLFLYLLQSFYNIWWKKNTYDDKTLTKKTGDICLENFENPWKKSSVLHENCKYLEKTNKHPFSSRFFFFWKTNVHTDMF